VLVVKSSVGTLSRLLPRREVLAGDNVEFGVGSLRHGIFLFRGHEAELLGHVAECGIRMQHHHAGVKVILYKNLRSPDVTARRGSLGMLNRRNVNTLEQFRGSENREPYEDFLVLLFYPHGNDQP